MGAKLAGLIFDDGESELDDGCVLLGAFEEELQHAGHHAQPRWLEVFHVDGFGQVNHHYHCPQGVNYALPAASLHSLLVGSPFACALDDPVQFLELAASIHDDYNNGGGG